jgi:hypothetical protein
MKNRVLIQSRIYILFTFCFLFSFSSCRENVPAVKAVKQNSVILFQCSSVDFIASIPNLILFSKNVGFNDLDNTFFDVKFIVGGDSSELNLIQHPRLVRFNHEGFDTQSIEESLLRMWQQFYGLDNSSQLEYADLDSNYNKLFYVYCGNRWAGLLEGPDHSSMFSYQGNSSFDIISEILLNVKWHDK